MKISCLLGAAMFAVFFSSAYADTYQWVDEKGVVNFTDNPENVPEKYLKKVRIIRSERVEPEEAASAPAVSTPSISQPTAESSPRANLYGGHDESWWRSRYASLRSEIKALQDGLPAKREELENLRRKLVVYTFARNREAYQAKLAEIQQDEARINDLTAQLAKLDSEASAAGVPFSWRQ